MVIKTLKTSLAPSFEVKLLSQKHRILKNLGYYDNSIVSLLYCKTCKIAQILTIKNPQYKFVP